MRKSIFSMALLCMCVSFNLLNAQTEKGNFYLGGNGSLTYHTRTTTLSYDGDENLEFVDNKYVFNPSIGYFVMGGLVLGVDVSFVTMTTDYDYPDSYLALIIESAGSGLKYQEKVTSTELMTGVFAKYYFGSRRLKPFANVKLGLVKIKEDVDYYGDIDPEKYDVSGMGVAGSVGAIYFLNDHVGLELGAGYGIASTKDKDDDKLELKAHSIAISVGVYVTF